MVAVDAFPTEETVQLVEEAEMIYGNGELDMTAVARAA